MALTYFRPRGDIKANWESINPILKIREMGIEWETEIGVGKAKIKFGDGVSSWNDLDYAVNIEEDVIKAFDEYSQSEDSPFVNKNDGKINNKIEITNQDKSIKQEVEFSGDTTTDNAKSILNLTSTHSNNGTIVRGIADPEENQDAANKKYIDEKTKIASSKNTGVVKSTEEITVEEDGGLKIGKILDKYGVVGEAQQSQLLTEIVDTISNKVMNELMNKTLMSNVQVNSDNNVPTSGLVYEMNQQISSLNAKTSTQYQISNGDNRINFQWQNYGLLSFTVKNYGNYGLSSIISSDVFAQTSDGNRVIIKTLDNVTAEIFQDGENYIKVKATVPDAIQYLKILAFH